MTDFATDEGIRATLDAAGIGTWSYHLPSKTAALSRTCREMFGIPEDVVVDLPRLD